MYSTHVTLDLSNFPTKGRSADICLGIILVLASVIGFIGNILALLHFRSQQTKREADIINSLYIAVCTVDISICSTTFNVIYCLFNDRHPGLFNNLPFCTFWAVLFSFQQKISMFLVMLLSVSRAIKVIFNTYEIQLGCLISSFIMYTLVILILDLVVFFLAHPQFSYFYSADSVYCYEYVSSGYNTGFKALHLVVMVMNNMKVGIQVGLPPLIIFASFLVCIFKLINLLSVTRQRRFSTKRYANALMTTTLFTSIFLLCNLPYFILKVLETVSTFYYKTYPGPIFEGQFMYWYSFITGRVHCTTLNSCLNPVLYYWRISAFKQNVDVSLKRSFSRISPNEKSGWHT